MPRSASCNPHKALPCVPVWPQRDLAAWCPTRFIRAQNSRTRSVSADGCSLRTRHRLSKFFPTQWGFSQKLPSGRHTALYTPHRHARGSRPPNRQLPTFLESAVALLTPGRFEAGVSASAPERAPDHRICISMQKTRNSPPDLARKGSSCPNHTRATGRTSLHACAPLTTKDCARSPRGTAKQSPTFSIKHSSNTSPERISHLFEQPRRHRWVDHTRETVSE